MKLSSFLSVAAAVTATAAEAKLVTKYDFFTVYETVVEYYTIFPGQQQPSDYDWATTWATTFTVTQGEGGRKHTHNRHGTVVSTSVVTSTISSTSYVTPAETSTTPTPTPSSTSIDPVVVSSSSPEPTTSTEEATSSTEEATSTSTEEATTSTAANVAAAATTSSSSSDSDLEALGITFTEDKASNVPSDYSGPVAGTHAYALAIVQQHNEYRALHGAVSMVWNQTIADFAKDYITNNNCVFEHSGGPYGENIAAGYTPEGGTKAWYNEESSYDYAAGEYSESTGHFTQVVWNASTSVGCYSRYQCPTYGEYFYCEYYPRGNIIGYFTENVFALKS